MNDQDAEIAMMPPDMVPFFEGILRTELEGMCARGEMVGITRFTMTLGICQGAIQTLLQVSRPITLRMLRHYLDAMEAPQGSPKHQHHARKFAAAGMQLAEVLNAQASTVGHA